MTLLPLEPLAGAQVLPSCVVNTHKEVCVCGFCLHHMMSSDLLPSHTSERHTDTEDTAFQGCSCWQTCSLLGCLVQTQ